MVEKGMIMTKFLALYDIKSDKIFVYFPDNKIRCSLICLVLFMLWKGKRKLIVTTDYRN